MFLFKQFSTFNISEYYAKLTNHFMCNDFPVGINKKIIWSTQLTYANQRIVCNALFAKKRNSNMSKKKCLDNVRKKSANLIYITCWENCVCRHYTTLCSSQMTFKNILVCAIGSFYQPDMHNLNNFFFGDFRLIYLLFTIKLLIQFD